MGVELIFTSMDKNGQYNYVDSAEFELVSRKGSKCYFVVDLVPEKAGSFFYGIRLYPKHKDLPHKQDFYLLRWIE